MPCSKVFQLSGQIISSSFPMSSASALVLDAWSDTGPGSLERPRCAGAHVLRQVAMKVGRAALHIRIGFRARKSQGLQALLHRGHVGEVLSEDVAPGFFRRRRVYPFGHRFLPLRKELVNCRLEDALVGIVTVRSGAVAQHVVDGMPDLEIGKDLPSRSALADMGG